MTQTTTDIQQYLDENATRFQDDLCQWLKMASIGTDPKYDDDVRAAAELKRDQIHSFGRDQLIQRCAGAMSSTIEPDCNE